MFPLKKISFLTSILFIIFASSFSQKKIYTQVDVKPTSEVKNATEQSLTYTLPKTTIKVVVKMEKVIKKAGPYFRYSKRFLNLSNVITEDSEEWEIKNVKISTYGVADESKRYSIFTKGKTSANMLTLTRDGILAGINTTSTFSKVEKTCKNKVPNLSNISFDNVPLNEELLYKTSTAAMAKEAANMVYKLRTNRTELLSGELENLPPDGEAYKTVLSEIAKQEQEFVSLFAGKTISTTKTEVFEITPDPLSSYANFVICRFNKSKGIVDAKDITGTPIYFKLDSENRKKLENKVTEIPKEPLKNGLYYNLPGFATIEIVDKNTPLLTQKVALAQYGQVISMSPSIVEKVGVVIEVCPVTGALISIGNK